MFEAQAQHEWESKHAARAQSLATHAVRCACDGMRLPANKDTHTHTHTEIERRLHSNAVSNSECLHRSAVFISRQEALLCYPPLSCSTLGSAECDSFVIDTRPTGPLVIAEQSS